MTKIIKKIKFKKWVYKTIIGIFIFLIIFSIFMIFNRLNSSNDGKYLNKELNDKYVIKNKDNYDINFSKLKDLNKNTVGYIKVNNTDINYIVVKGDNNKYYKNHNFNNKYSSLGWIFMDSNTKLDGTDKNIIIYGNNEKDKSMFGTLDKVLTSEWQNNKDNHIITFVSDNFEYKYQVFSTYKTYKKDYLKIDFETGADYNSYLKEIKNNSNYDYNVNLDSYDNILTLTTISGSKRIVLHAKMIK